MCCANIILLGRRMLSEERGGCASTQNSREVNLLEHSCLGAWSALLT